MLKITDVATDGASERLLEAARAIRAAEALPAKSATRFLSAAQAVRHALRAREPRLAVSILAEFEPALRDVTEVDHKAAAEVLIRISNELSARIVRTAAL